MAGKVLDEIPGVDTDIPDSVPHLSDEISAVGTDKPDILAEPGTVSVLSVPASGIPTEISAHALAPGCIAEWLSPALPRQQAKVLAVHEDGTFEAFHPLSEIVCRMPTAWITRVLPPYEDSCGKERSTSMDEQALILLDQGTVADVEFVREADINGVRMAVATDGRAFLSEFGVAALCGVSVATIEVIRVQWNERPVTPRIAKIKQSVAHSGHIGPSVPVTAVLNGVRQYYFPIEACRSILEYFAMDAGPDCTATAQKHFYKLAMTGLNDAIRQSVGADPATAEDRRWAKWRERMDPAYECEPPGYFSIFGAIQNLILKLVQAEVDVNEHTVPDSSIEDCWSQHWEQHEFARECGDRVRYTQQYPPSHPYAKSSPQQDAWAYPEKALGTFRTWLRESYVGGGQFAQALKEKVARHEMTEDEASRTVAAVCRAQIGNPTPKKAWRRS